MTKDFNILAIIPARVGSKGLPGKNIRPLLGKPLITWSIEQALGSKYVNEHCCPKRFSMITNFIDFTCFKCCKNAQADIDFISF
jgi:spore coat polysaccharide biosynthesis protein SpsF (cytidylyltransferase family)